MKRILFSTIVLFLGLAACGMFDVPLFTQKKDNANTTYSEINGDQDDESSKASVLFPAGLLPSGISLGISLGANILEAGFLSSIAVSGDVQTLGPSINFDASGDVPDSAIGQLQIGIPYTEASGLALANLQARTVVLFHVRTSDGKMKFGFINYRDLRFEDEKIFLFAVGFGNYQVALFEEEPKENISKTTTEEVKTQATVDKEEEKGTASATPTPTPATGGNTAPVLATIGNLSHAFSSTLTYTLSATDAEGDGLTFSCSENCPSGLSVTAAGVVTWTTTSSNIGTYSGIKFEVSDGNLSDSETITITVTTPSVATGNLIAHYDAAKYDGSTFAGTGCSNTTWKNLEGTAGTDMTLQSFGGSCATNGWQGAGTSADPYALLFDSTSTPDYAEVVGSDGAGSVFKVAFSAITLMAWVRGTSTASRGIAGFGYCNSITCAGPYLLYLDSNSFPLLHLNTLNTSAKATTAISPNTWTHVAATYSAGTLKYYQNGVIDGTRTVTNGNLAITSDKFRVAIGSQVATSFDGKIAVVMFYNRVLSATEILQNCNAHVTRFSGVSCGGP